MDDTDKAILNRIQSNFPTVPRPYKVIARELGISENNVLDRVRRLKTHGIVRRIGANFVPGKLGFVSTLCAGKVPEDQIDAFAGIVNSYQGVTHNYVRDNSYNIWFTFIAPSMEDINRCLSEISKKTGVSDILNLPATKVFKIRAHFDL